jgi:hypothetical protein
MNLYLLMGSQARHKYENRCARKIFPSLASNAVTRVDAILTNNSARL